MKRPKGDNWNRAFTRLELMVVVAVVLLAAVLVAFFLQASQKGTRITCVGNLMQIGIASRIWADDNQGAYPTRFYTNAAGEPRFLGADMFRYLQVMSNELNTPLILVCPADRQRTYTTDWVAGFDNNHISYFVGFDVNSNLPNTFLAGDRNITNGTSLTNGVLVLTTNLSAGWTMKMHRGVGDVVLADGSVQQMDDKLLNEAIVVFGTNINRLAIP
jgi:type II secretory pathway pseudopilin PulG